MHLLGQNQKSEESGPNLFFGFYVIKCPQTIFGAPLVWENDIIL